MRAFVILIATTMILGGCSSAKSTAAAEGAITGFHKALNATQFAAIYQDSSPDFKTVTTGPAFTQLLGAVHRKLGGFKSGTSVGWNDNYTTNGEFVTVTYDAAYERGKAQESFVYRMTGGRPAMAGYHISSEALILN